MLSNLGPISWVWRESCGRKLNREYGTRSAPRQRLACLRQDHKESLILVTPETVVRWHRAGFRLYWRWISRAQEAVGRKPISREVRELIFRIVAENPTWGAPRIHGELLKPGFDISERTVSRWVKRATRNPDPARRWLAFLRNHREAIAAMDFFTVPTLTFGVLYCFFVIGHDRRLPVSPTLCGSYCSCAKLGDTNSPPVSSLRPGCEVLC
jgi:hypothetical protein